VAVLNVQQISENVQTDMLVSVADFSENYRAIMQDEPQSAHYSYNQVTVHPFHCIYNEEEIPKRMDVVIIS